MLHLCINTETYTNQTSAQETSDWAAHSAAGKSVTHSQNSCVQVYCACRLSTLDGQKRSPAHLCTLWYQLFRFIASPWSNPTISFSLNGCLTQTRSLSTETNAVRRWISLCSLLRMGSKGLYSCKATIHHCQQPSVVWPNPQKLGDEPLTPVKRGFHLDMAQ